MGAIKIGEAEKLIISRIDQIKEKHKVLLDGALKGLRIIRNQIPDSEDTTIQEIKNQANETIKRAENLSHAIQGIEFSQEYDENKFYIAWAQVDDKTGSHYKYGFGKSISREEVSEKQFIFALCSWEREVCKRLALFKELEGLTYDSLCPTLELDIRKMLHEYVIKS